ncbi:MAG: F0F1 ATP synthase subunit delta [Magnetovibrionaceae bacterium]
MTSEVTGATGLAARYASALFDLAVADKALDTVAADLDQLHQMVQESEDLNRLLSSPVISRDDQKKAMAAIAEKAGFSKLTQNFIGTVAANRRLFALPGMLVAFRRQLAAHRGEATAEVVSAKPLSDAQLAALADSLKKAIGTKVSVESKVDPSLLGGLVVKVGSKMIDSSLKTKLAQMRLAMKGVA